MVSQYVTALELPISRDRLEGCRPYGGNDLDMVSTYLWNISLSEALYCSLHVLEVTLRNSIHTILSRHFQTPYWFDTPGLLLAHEFDALNGAKSKLLKRKRPLDAGRIVAEVSFGFWAALLRQPYNARIWKRWSYAPLIDTFPHIPRGMRDRETIWRRIDAQRAMRNRVFHYEPIWNRASLWQDYKGICATIGWISPEMRATLNRLDRFPDIHANGRDQILTRLRHDLRV